MENWTESVGFPLDPAPSPVARKYAVFDQLIEGAQVIAPDWRYLYLNASALEQSKYTESELLGQHMQTKYPGIDQSEMFMKLRTCMETGAPMQLLNNFIFPDGSQGWFDLRMECVPEGVLILSFDVSQLKQVEAELATRLENEVRMRERIDHQKQQLEDFCQIIAHNMRAPLSNLLLLTDFVEEAETVEEKLMFLEKQKPIIQYLLQTFEGLVELTQIRADHQIKRARMNLEKCIELNLALLEGEILASGARITWDLSAVDTVDYPEAYLNSIVFNLLSNALKYHSLERVPEIRIRTILLENWICLEVADNGLGIDLEKHHKKVFQLGKTFHQHPGARGFGLFMTKIQVEAMGGAIAVESVPEQGCRFSVRLVEIDKNEKN